MNIYGSQIWPYSKNCPSKFYISWRKAIRRLWKIPYRTHNKFIHIINNCMPIDITLEKRCIKYLWNMINSNCKLYHNIVNLSLNNLSTTIGENLRYFMYKNMIQEYYWYESINIIIRKLIVICCRISMQKFSVMRLSSENYVNRETRVVICYLVARAGSFH